MKKVNEKKAVKAEKKVSKSETRRSAVQKKPAVKAAKPAKKVVSEDEVAFNKFIDSFDQRGADAASCSQSTRPESSAASLQRKINRKVQYSVNRRAAGAD